MNEAGEPRFRLEAKISFGNILTIIGGIFFAGVVIVSITRAYDRLEAQVDRLSDDVKSISDQVTKLDHRVGELGRPR